MPTLETARRTSNQGTAWYATFSIGDTTLPIFPMWLTTAAPASTPTLGGATTGGGGSGASRGATVGATGRTMGACTGDSQNSAKLALRSSTASTDKMAAARRLLRRSSAIF